MLPFTCKNCNLNFFSYITRGKPRVFCSMECKSEFSHEFVVCPECKKTFKKLKCVNTFLCGKKCSLNYSWKNKRKKAESKLLECLNCRKSFSKNLSRLRERNRSIKFCCRSCYIDFKTSKKTTECGFCKIAFKPNRNANKFCSNKCVYLWRHDRNKDNPGKWYENGYIVVYDENGKGIKEHIKIMQEHLGRKIDTKKEHIHHINGIKDDNRLENLQLMTPSEHIRHHRLEEIKAGVILGIHKKRCSNHSNQVETGNGHL